MKKQIRKPENWQDFEELCKVLWGEIWNCAEIKKNGRSGQNQNGVDIYGIPKGELKYYGIQCKGKDEYTNSVLTEKEVLSEIEKAKSFKPLLNKLYFATTANKDERIEEFVRLKNVEHLESNLFEVHLFSWEDIAYLIDQNRRAHDWYIRKIDFASSFKIEVTFDDESNDKIFEPILIKNYIKYKYASEDFGVVSLMHYRSAESIREDRIRIDTEPQPFRYFINGKTRNKSSCVFSIRLTNIGSLQLENFKLYLTFDDSGYTSEIVWKQARFLDSVKYNYNISWAKGTDNLEFTANEGILVQNDFLVSDRICIRPTIEFPFCVIIPWKLVAKDFTESGVLKIVLNTKVQEKHSTVTYSSYFEDEIILQNYSANDSE